MRNQTLRLFLLILPPLLLFALAAIITILDRISKNALYSNLTRNMRTGAFEVHLMGHTTTHDVTLNIDSGPTYAILGTCIIGYFVVALGVAGVWQLRRVEGTAGHDRMWAWMMFIANIVMIGAALGSFGYASSVQSGDKGWEGVDSVWDDGGAHTKETWSCEISRVDPNQQWAPRTCSTAKAVRFTLIGLAIAAMLVFGSLWVLVRARGGLKWVFGGKGRYAGFQSVYEMLTPAGSYVGPPPMGTQWVQQPGQQWHGQPVQQWSGQQYMPQPYQQWGPQPIQQWPGQPVQQGSAQPVQQWPGQPVHQGGPQPVVQVPKSDVTVEQRPVP
jgi:hypothetical protein